MRYQCSRRRISRSRALLSTATRTVLSDNRNFIGMPAKKTIANHCADDRTEDNPSCDVRKPMETHGCSEADDRGVRKRPVFQLLEVGIKQNKRYSHRERYRGVRRGPAPKNPLLKKPKVEKSAHVLGWHDIRKLRRKSAS